eukprot:52853-Chlamydomonas_euryale.AAC.13
MSLRSFFALLRASRALPPGSPGAEVPYVQHQNSSLTAEYPQLAGDCPAPEWAARAFGAPPEASNLWIGDERSVTSFHKGRSREGGGGDRGLGRAIKKRGCGQEEGRHARVIVKHAALLSGSGWTGASHPVNVCCRHLQMVWGDRTRRSQTTLQNRPGTGGAARITTTRHRQACSRAECPQWICLEGCPQDSLRGVPTGDSLRLLRCWCSACTCWMCFCWECESAHPPTAAKPPPKEYMPLPLAPCPPPPPPVPACGADHYENLYAVLVGTKVFHLLPPCDVWRMATERCPVARWRKCGAAGGGSAAGGIGGRAGGGGGGGCPGLVPVQCGDRRTVSWSGVDPTPAKAAALAAASAAAAPHFFDPGLPGPLVANVGPGEVLYLPAMWQHYVTQRCSSPGHDYVVAVNFW